MRIISGKFRHRKLIDCQQFRELRPTTDANREALFNILTNGSFLAEINFSLINAQVLDLCCGTGALSFEAISRGAKFVTLVDNNSQHLLIAKQNAEKLLITNDCNFILTDVNKLPKNQQIFDLIFVDPPYHFDYQVIIKELVAKNYLSDKTLLVIEHNKKDQVKDSKKSLPNQKFDQENIKFNHRKNNLNLAINHGSNYGDNKYSNHQFNQKYFQQKSNNSNGYKIYVFPSEDDLKKLNLRILQRRNYGNTEFIFLNIDPS